MTDNASLTIFAAIIALLVLFFITTKPRKPPKILRIPLRSPSTKAPTGPASMSSSSLPASFQHFPQLTACSYSISLRTGIQIRILWP